MTSMTTPAAADSRLTLLRRRLLGRAPALLVCAACATVLGLAAWLDPSGAGIGTHTQLGLAPCGFLAVTGLPCATCGMTTSFALAADGRLIASFLCQPAGCLLAVTTAAAAWISGYAALAGVSLLPLGRLLLRPRTFIVAGGVVLAAWAYKVLAVAGVLNHLLA